jgi:5-methylcytosine-specific restriction endonuclease McrA
MIRPTHERWAQTSAEVARLDAAYQTLPREPVEEGRWSPIDRSTPAHHEWHLRWADATMEESRAKKDWVKAKASWRLEVDHEVPLWAGGTNDLSNLRAVCRPCHKAKTAAEAKERAALRRGNKD